MGNIGRKDSVKRNASPLLRIQAEFDQNGPKMGLNWRRIGRNEDGMGNNQKDVKDSKSCA
jgi:hypothetical protein